LVGRHGRALNYKVLFLEFLRLTGVATGQALGRFSEGSGNRVSGAVSRGAENRNIVVKEKKQNKEKNFTDWLQSLYSQRVGLLHCMALFSAI